MSLFITLSLCACDFRNSHLFLNCYKFHMLAFKHAQVAAAVGSKLIHNSIDRAKSNSSQSNNLIESGEREKKSVAIKKNKPTKTYSYF